MEESYGSAKMNVKHISVLAATDYFKPALRFTFGVRYRRSQEALLSLSGSITIQDKTIAMLMPEVSFSGASLQAIRYIGEQFEEVEQVISAVAIFDRQSLSFIEESRRLDRKGDVKIDIKVLVDYVLNKTQMSYVVEFPFDSVPLSEQFKSQVSKTFGTDVNNISLLLYAYLNDRYLQPRGNLVLLSSNTSQNTQGAGYLSVEHFETKFEAKIASSDWINDIAPVLGLGEFFVVEIPKGERTLKDAWAYVDLAEKSLMRWDTKSICANCRNAGDLLDQTLKVSLGESSFAYKERWGRAFARLQGRTSFKDQASIDLHIEDFKKTYPPEQVKISVADAEYLIIVTKALIKLAQHLISEKGS